MKDFFTVSIKLSKLNSIIWQFELFIFFIFTRQTTWRGGGGGLPHFKRFLLRRDGGWDWKATNGCADQRLNFHSLSLCWISCSQLKSLCRICYSQLRSLLLEWLPTPQTLCLSITAHSSAHKSRVCLPCDGVFSNKSLVFFGKVSPHHLLSCWKRRVNLFQEKW